MYLVCPIYISGCVGVGNREVGGRGTGRGGVKELGVGMWREEYIYMKILSTGDVFYSRVSYSRVYMFYMFYVNLFSDCKVLCNN